MAYKIDTLKNVYHQKASKFSDRKRIKNYSVRCFTFMQAIAQPKNPDDFWLASQV